MKYTSVCSKIAKLDNLINFTRANKDYLDIELQ